LIHFAFTEAAVGC